MTPDWIKDAARERFESFVEKIPFHSCWEWVGPINSGGYGQFGGKQFARLAHRAAWIFYRGVIPGSLFVCHSCDNRSCVNPDHLWLGTAADNMHDRDAKGRGVVPMTPRREVCIKGHPLSGENLGTKVDKRWDHERRYCKACHNDQTALRSRERRRLGLVCRIGHRLKDGRCACRRAS